MLISSSSPPAVRRYQPIIQDAETQIRPGLSYEPRLAAAELNKNKLVEDLIKLRESTDEQDVLRYISSGQVIENLEKLGLFSMSQFSQDLSKIIADQSRGLQTRKQALFELLLSKNVADKIIKKPYLTSVWPMVLQNLKNCR